MLRKLSETLQKELCACAVCVLRSIELETGNTLIIQLNRKHIINKKCWPLRPSVKTCAYYYSISQCRLKLAMRYESFTIYIQNRYSIKLSN